jgi:hypothetical protein
LSIEEDLQQEIAEFSRQLIPIAVVDGLDDLVGLLDGVRLDSVKGLLAIPRAAARGVRQ